MPTEREVQATITAALGTLVDRLPGGWPDANPYLRRHLAAHAAAAQAGDEPGPLDRLIADSGFLAAADTSHLAAALPRATRPDAQATARTYLRAAHLLRAATPAERASILTLVAAQEEPAATPTLKPLPASLWQARWAAWRQSPFHLLLAGHQGGVAAVAFARLPDGRTILASGDDDATVRLWDPLSGQPTATLTGHQGWVSAVAFARLPDGRTILASGSADRTVRLWDPLSGQTLGVVPIGAPCTSLAAWDGGLLAVGAERGLVVLDLLRLPRG